MFMIINNVLGKRENYTDENDIVFYPSNIRTRDYQDIISITESQIIKTT